MESPTSDLAGRLVLVTGAAKRIGRGIALRLAREGARVAIHYGTSEMEAIETARECAAVQGCSGGPAKVAGDPGHVRPIEYTCGQIYGLVSNAAFASPAPTRSTQRDRVGLHPLGQPEGDLFCCQAAARRNARGRRRAYRQHQLARRPEARAEHAHYCASKAGSSTTRRSAKAGPHVTVNSVAPGVIPFEDIDERGKKMIGETPARRGGTPEEVADAVVYFLKASEFVTGQVMAVDGGLSLR
jgi:3-oxoacyl-[acyl-carrier protein] reductase/pteridine reductase